MQLPEIYKENFDISSKGLSSSEGPSVEILLIFSGSCIPTNESLFLLALNFYQTVLSSIHAILSSTKNSTSKSQSYFASSIIVDIRGDPSK
jgi:hypothetical protein